jgi:hypothetical protein
MFKDNLSKQQQQQQQKKKKKNKNKNKNKKKKKKKKQLTPVTGHASFHYTLQVSNLFWGQ